MKLCEKCKKPLDDNKGKYCAYCCSERAKKRADFLKGVAKVATIVAPFVLAIITKKPPKKF